MCQQNVSITCDTWFGSSLKKTDKRSHKISLGIRLRA